MCRQQAQLGRWRLIIGQPVTTRATGEVAWRRPKLHSTVAASQPDSLQLPGRVFLLLLKRDLIYYIPLLLFHVCVPTVKEDLLLVMHGGKERDRVFFIYYFFKYVLWVFVKSRETGGFLLILFTVSS